MDAHRDGFLLEKYTAPEGVIPQFLDYIHSNQEVKTKWFLFCNQYVDIDRTSTLQLESDNSDPTTDAGLPIYICYTYRPFLLWLAYVSTG